MNQGIAVESLCMDIIADELADLSISLSGCPGCKIDEQTIGNSGLGCISPKALEQNRVGPIHVGTLELAIKYSDRKAHHEVDSQSLDLVCYLSPSPLITPSSTSVYFMSELISSSSTAEPTFDLARSWATLRLYNHAPYTVAYKIESSACRRPGLLLLMDMPSRTSKHAYDTIDVEVTPNTGTVQQNSFLDVSIRLIPGHTAGLDQRLREDSGFDRSVLARVPVVINCTSHGLHPSAAVDVIVKARDYELNFIRTKPVTEIRRYKQVMSAEASDDILDIGDCFKGVESPALVNLQLRGLTFSASTGRYNIVMGQHSQRNESIEWLLKLENGSKTEEIEYRLHTEDPIHDKSWISLGHTFAVVPPKSFSCVVIYFNRAKSGTFQSVIYVEHTSPASAEENALLINVSIEITPTINNI